MTFTPRLANKGQKSSCVYSRFISVENILVLVKFQDQTKALKKSLKSLIL